ncbi:MAG: DUF167 domain-containing protein [Candidatus Pacearchaeota archaeon]
MLINVKVKPESSKEGIKLEGDSLIVKIKEKVEDSRANLSIISLISKHYGVPHENIKIKEGSSSKNKRVEILY